jgi:hypothetical protein
VLAADFPAAADNTFVSHDTRVVPLKFGTSVEVVLQDPSILGAESHPLHLHGHDSYVVGSGFGNYDANNDTTKYNLVDPVQRKTVSACPPPNGSPSALSRITPARGSCTLPLRRALELGPVHGVARQRRAAAEPEAAAAATLTDILWRFSFGSCHARIRSRACWKVVFWRSMEESARWFL